MMADQSDYLRECQRLHEVQKAASTPDERAAANDDLAHFLRLNGQGRLSEWFDARSAAANDRGDA